MIEKPLHVRTAEALGHRVRSYVVEDGANLPSATQNAGRRRVWEIWSPFEWEPGEGTWLPVPRYDLCWGAGGPLIHRFKLRILPMQPDNGGVAKPGPDWRWQITPYPTFWSKGDPEGLGRFGESRALEALMPYSDRAENEAGEKGAVIFLDAPSELVGVCYLIIAMGKAGWIENPPQRLLHGDEIETG
jgi:hypothetical protein